MNDDKDAIALLKLNNVIELSNLKKKCIDACFSVEGSWADDTWNNAVYDCIRAIERIEHNYIDVSVGNMNGASLARLCNIPEGTISESKLDLLVFAIIKTYEQSLTDPENQPSQFNTVPLEWYTNLENKLERFRFKIDAIIDSLYGSYENHAIRKALQEAIND